MTVLWIVLAAVAVLALLALFLLWPGRPSAEKTAPFYGRNYAHRGLHSRDKMCIRDSPETLRRGKRKQGGRSGAASPPRRTFRRDLRPPAPLGVYGRRRGPTRAGAGRV